LSMRFVIAHGSEALGSVSRQLRRYQWTPKRRRRLAQTGATKISDFLTA